MSRLYENRLTVGQLKALLAEQPDDVVVAVQCCNGSDVAHVLEAGEFTSTYGREPETYSLDPMVYKTMYDDTLLVFSAESDYVGYADRDLDDEQDDGLADDEVIDDEPFIADTGDLLPPKRLPMHGEQSGVCLTKPCPFHDA